MGSCSSSDSVRNDIVVGKMVSSLGTETMHYTDNPLNMVENTNTPLTKLLVNDVSDMTVQLIKNQLENGADPNIPCISDDGKILLSPLYLCCIMCHNDYGYQICELLINAGADANPKYMPLANLSPLMIIPHSNHTKTAPKFVKLLLENGSNPKLWRNKKTALDVLHNEYEGPDKQKIFDMLKEYSKNFP